MKWRELYSALYIRDEEEQPDTSLVNFFQRMRRGWFTLKPLCAIHDEGGNFDHYLAGPQDLRVRIIKVQLCKEEFMLDVEVDTQGSVLPPGIRHGKYCLKLRDGEHFIELPTEMFEEGEVPEDEQLLWKNDSYLING